MFKRIPLVMVLLLLLMVMTSLACSIAGAQPVSAGAVATITPATAPARAAAGGVVSVIVEVLNKMALVLPFLLAFGAGWKYLPVLKNAINEGLIPILNAVLAFLIGFGGGVGTAHAGIFGDIGKALSIPAQLAASVLLSYLSTLIHDKFLKPITPSSPYTAGKLAAA